MARRKRASRKRARESFPGERSMLVDSIDMRLHRARGFADALTWVGHGLQSVEDDGAGPVQAIAAELLDDLDSLKASWDTLIALPAPAARRRAKRA